MTDALMQNVHAVHICNWEEYVSSLRAMLPWMVAYDNKVWEVAARLLGNADSSPC